MYLEDVDVAARATVMGWTSYFVPGRDRLPHGLGEHGWGRRNLAIRVLHDVRNNFGVLVKNLPWTILLRVLIRFPRADSRTIRGLLRAGERRTAVEVVRGRLVIVLRLPIYLRKRARLRNVRRVERDELWSLMERGCSASPVLGRSAEASPPRVGWILGVRPTAAESR